MEITLYFIVFRGGKIPVAVPYSEGGNLTEPYIKSTDEYVRETDVTYIVESDNIRLEGHPFKGLDDHNHLVNPSRFNVVQLDLPDMNKLYLPPYQGQIGLDTEVAVWKLVGLRVDIQGPLEPAVTGQCQTGSISTDSGAVNPTQGIFYERDGSTIEDGDGDPDAALTTTYAWGMEHKQIQLLAVGCDPLLGVFEGKPSGENKNRDSSQLVVGDTERVVVPIQDGFLHEFGYGNLDYENLCEDKTMLPIEMCYNNFPTLIVDKMTMANDKTGNAMFFCWDRIASGIRHTRNTKGINFPNNPSAVGETSDAAPDWKPQQHMPQAQSTKTAGMVSSGMDLFNKNYWLNKAAGPNNGVLWNNKMYVTFVDNTRGHIHMVTTYPQSDQAAAATYDPTKTKAYLRHIKEFKVTALVRLCHVKLEAKLITWLLQFNSKWLQNLGFKFNYPPGDGPFSGFREVFQPQLGSVQEEEENELRVIKIDCSGHASLQHSHSSPHTLATSYHAANPVSTPTGATVGRGRGGASRGTKARKS
ncbi:L1 protein [Papillomaviridae sp. Haddock_c6033]|nr:L1 protein [Papillomaviridae sp. Haddock_c6033]